MFNYIRDIKKILKRKNAQIRAEREKLNAAEAANRIYAAYIAWLVAESGEVHIPKRDISALLGRYRAEVSFTSDDYIISIKELDNKESVMDGGGCGEK